MIDQQPPQTDHHATTTRPGQTAGEQALPRVRVYTQHPAYRMARRFSRHRIGLIGLLVLGLLVLLAILAPVLSPYDQNATNLRLINAPPSAQHMLGTDDLGRDIWTRMLYGARVSMLVGIVAVGIYTLIGTALGSIAGYFGGHIDNLIMRFTEVVMCFPSFMLIMTMVVVLKPSLFNVMIIIGVFGWTGLARLVRGQVLSIRERDYVLAARAIGARQGRILVRHILPSTIAPILVSATLGLSGAVLTESGLSFLGIGVQAPQASWGSMLNTAMQLSVLQGKPWRWLPPAVAIALMVLAVNFIGDALRDALDPQMTD
jgi:peptide/nickel transport system permease protein